MQKNNSRPEVNYKHAKIKKHHSSRVERVYKVLYDIIFYAYTMLEFFSILYNGIADCQVDFCEKSDKKVTKFEEKSEKKSEKK